MSEKLDPRQLMRILLANGGSDPLFWNQNLEGETALEAPVSVKSEPKRIKSYLKFFISRKGAECFLMSLRELR
jgi:hypothetical protein